MPTSLRIAAALLGTCLLLSCGERQEPGPAPASSQKAPQERVLKAGARLLRAGANGLPGRYIVVFEDSGAHALRASPLEVHKASSTLAQTHGAAVRRVYSSALKGFSAAMSEAQALRMSEDPRVRYVEQERVLTLHGTQSNATWGLDRVDQRNLPLNSVYNYEYTGAGVHAYVLDTGLRDTHVEFTGRVGEGFNAVADGMGITDCHGHGTHVAGTVGGTTYGVAKDVTIHPVRVIGCSGEGTLEELLAGIDWVSTHHVKPAVANMSLGASALQSIDDAVNASIALGITYVVSAGNEGMDACGNSPARTPPAITVGATDRFDQRAYWSNYGTCVDLFAPGDEITSAWFTGDTALYDTSGTSMAAPHVAGAAALYLEGHPQATPAEVHEELVARSTRGLVQDAMEGSPDVLLHSACMGSIDGVKPEVAIISPADGALLTGGVTFSATASDDVAISKVEFSVDGELIATDTEAPYEVSWNSNQVGNGPHTVSVRAFDVGCNSRSASVSVSIHNPGKAAYDGALKAPRCEEPASQCDSVDLLEGRGVLGPEAHAPNTLFHSCADGNEGWYGFEPSIEQLKVVRDDGTLLAGGKRVRIEATFYAGFDAAQERLELFSAPDASAPVWTHVGTIIPLDVGLNVMSTTFILPTGGMQAIRGVYRLGGTVSPCVPGNLNDHDDLVLTVVEETDTEPPTATLTAPAAGAVLRGTAKLSATAGDNFGVTFVEFYDGDTLLGTDATEPFTLSWDTLSVPNGVHTLTVRAYDAAGFVGTSPGVEVTIDNDRTPPTVTFSAPAEGAAVKGTVTVSVTATDNVKVTRVEWYLDGTKLADDTTSPYNYSWDTRQVDNGPHVFTARAFDAIGNMGSAERTVTSDNDFTPPTVTLTAPAEGATLKGSATFSATASDNVAVTKVVFFADGTQIASDTTAPYSVSYNTRNLPNGTKVITARAQDAMNNMTTSEPVSVTFENDFTPPTVELTAPTEGETLTGTVTFAATASDDQGTLSKVIFYVDGSQIGTDTSAPYALSYNTRNKSNGAKVLKAVAYDAAGNLTNSALVNVTFDNDLTAPTTSITSPTGGSTVSGTVLIEATASDAQSAITKVDFYRGTTLLGSDTTAPYSFSWDTSKVNTGSYTLKSRAYDAAGNSAYSTAVSVTVTR